MAKKVVFAWENLGPSHLDRLKACAADSDIEVAAIEFFAKSTVYDWETCDGLELKRTTLYPNRRIARDLGLAWRLTLAILRERPDEVFLCHYNFPPVFVAAIILRLAGIPVYTMIDSKFDDMPRRLSREFAKPLLLAPYLGALVASRRTREYLHFLGFRRRPVTSGFDTLDLNRLFELTRELEIPSFADRDFLVVARLVPKKNLGFAIRAFAGWRKQRRHNRRLRLIGYGELEVELKHLVTELGVQDDVDFVGTLDARQVAQAMKQALCLILPSTEEQFGFVVVEALAQGLPVLVSVNAGAVDELIDNGVNGWVVDPYRQEALLAAMFRLDSSEADWQAASAAALASAERGDVRHFVAGVKALVQAG